MNYALVGAFVLVLGGLLIGIVLWLASGGAFQTKYDLYLAVAEESVSGLNLNAPVKYSGVDVGKVTGIRLDQANSERVRLIFAIERGTPIRTDTVAMLRTQGLTGIAHVELSGGATNTPLLTAAGTGELPEIQTIPSLGARLENVLSAVLGKLDSTSSNLNSILSDENRAAFKSALADIAAVARTISANRQAIDSGIAGAARTFDNSARATEQLDREIERIGRSAVALEKMGEAVARTSDAAGNTVEAVSVDLKRFTSETLPEFERLLGELGVLSASLRRLGEQTERNTAGILFGRQPLPDGPGETSQGPRSP